MSIEFMTGVTAKPQVLIVEDEPPIRELVRLHLSLAGFDVAEVGDGRRALDLARSTKTTRLNPIRQ